MIKAFDKDNGTGDLISSLVFDIEKYIDKHEEFNKDSNLEWVDLYGANPKIKDKEGI